MKKQIYCVCIVLLLSYGCSQQPVILVLRDAPQNPSFIVIPPNDFLSEVHFASDVEGVLIKSGAKVLRRPAGKAGEKASLIGKNLPINKETSDQGIIVTESYRDIDEFTSDYLIETFAEYRQLKFTNCKTKEIVSIFTIEKDSYDRDDLSQQNSVIEEFVKKIMSKSKSTQQVSPSKK